MTGITRKERAIRKAIEVAPPADTRFSHLALCEGPDCEGYGRKQWCIDTSLGLAAIGLFTMAGYTYREAERQSKTCVCENCYHQYYTA